MLQALVAGALLSFTPASPLVARSAAPQRAVAVAALDPAALDPKAIGGLFAVVAAGGVAYTQQQKKADGVASPPPPPKKAVAKPPPPPKAAAMKDSWGLKNRKGYRGGVNKPKPKTPKREIWKPPKGWKPPTKPVSSWYDRGDRLAPALAPAPPPAPPPPPKNFFEQLIEQIQGGGVAAAPAAPDSWGLKNRKGYRGGVNKPKPKTPKREIWKPPPGYSPPSMPSPAAAAPAAAAPAAATTSGKDSWGLTGAEGYRGGVNPPKPKPVARKVWKPPFGWKPPSVDYSKAPAAAAAPRAFPYVRSWYDLGMRL